MTTESTSKAIPTTDKKTSVKKPIASAKKAVPRSVDGKVVAKAVPAAKKSILKQTAKPKQTEKKDKQNKIKMVRDSFSMTEDDYANLIGMKRKCIAAGVQVKKSELMRVGLMGLMKLSNASLIAAVKQIAIGNNSKSGKA